MKVLLSIRQPELSGWTDQPRQTTDSNLKLSSIGELLLKLGIFIITIKSTSTFTCLRLVNFSNSKRRKETKKQEGAQFLKKKNLTSNETLGTKSLQKIGSFITSLAAMPLECAKTMREMLSPKILSKHPNLIHFQIFSSTLLQKLSFLVLNEAYHWC